jgi:hypothetical protein
MDTKSLEEEMSHHFVENERTGNRSIEGRDVGGNQSLKGIAEQLTRMRP